MEIQQREYNRVLRIKRAGNAGHCRRRAGAGRRNRSVALCSFSDANGETLVATEYTNGQKKDLKVPGFDGDNFFLTEVRILTEDGEDEVSLSTYSSIERGKTWYIATDYSEEFDDDVLGKATLNFANLPKGGHFGD